MEAAVPEIEPPAAKIGSKRKRDGPASENKGEKKPRKPAAVAEPRKTKGLSLQVLQGDCVLI